MFLNKKLKDCREKNGLSVEALLVALTNFGMQLSAQTIRNWEQGVHDPNASDLEMLAKFFKKPIAFFYN